MVGGAPANLFVLRVYCLFACVSVCVYDCTGNACASVARPNGHHGRRVAVSKSSGVLLFPCGVLRFTRELRLHITCGRWVPPQHYVAVEHTLQAWKPAVRVGRQLVLGSAWDVTRDAAPFSRPMTPIMELNRVGITSGYVENGKSPEVRHCCLLSLCFRGGHHRHMA